MCFGFNAVILAEGGDPDSQGVRVRLSDLRVPAFWIPGCAENDARAGTNDAAKKLSTSPDANARRA